MSQPAAYYRELRVRKAAKGICTYCANPAEPNKKLCAKHNAKRRQADAKKRLRLKEAKK